MMDFSSFDLDNTKEQQSIQHPYSNDTENFDQDASDFFAFIDPTNFHSTATGLDQQQQQQHAPPSMDTQLQSTHDSQSSTHIMSGGSNLPNDTQVPIRSNNSSYPLMSPMQMNVNEYQTPLQQPMVTDYPEDEEFFTPLISPAIPPNYYTNLRSDTNFSPLTSPALGPQQHSSMNHHYHIQQQHQQQQQSYSSTNYFSTSNTSQDGQSSEELQERLAMIERQQQQLRSHMQQSSSSPSSTATPAIAVTASPLSSSSSPVHKSTSAYGNSLSVNASNPSVTKPKQQTLRHKIAMSSPQFNPTAHSQSPRMHPSNHTHHNHPVARNSSSIGYQNTHTTISPATPSLLMKLGNGLHQNTNTSNNSNTTTTTSSPATLPMRPSHDSIIDNMMSLPDAMLPPSNTANKKKPVKKATISSTITSTSTTKRRRISYPRSAFTPPALLPSSSTTSSYQHSDHHDMATFDQGIAALVSPAALRPHIPTTSSSMMSPNGGNGGLTSSPRALKPLISPSLQPNGKRLSSIDEHEAATILASKSNYQALREGRAKSLGIDFNTNIQSGMENRRSAHKAAEQRRRDTLKQNFDALRMELLDALIREDEEEEEDDDDDNNKVEEEDGEKQLLATSRLEREKKVKQMSKVVLLQHSYEYMLRLKSENQTKDAKLDKMTKEIRRLRTECGMAPITEEERQAEAEEKQMEKEKRLARLKRLEDMVDT